VEKKIGKAGHAADDNIIGRRRFACWVTKTVDTHSEYVILIAVPRQQWLRERHSMLRCTHIPLLVCRLYDSRINPLNPELNPIYYLLALLAHHFLHVSRIRVKSLTIKLLMLYIYGAPILDVSRSHTTTQHSR